MVGRYETSEHYSSILQVTKNDRDVEGGNARVSIMWALISGGASFDARVFSLLYPHIPSTMVLLRLLFDTLRGTSEL